MSFTERSSHVDDIYGSPNIYDSPTKVLEPRLTGSIEKAVDHCNVTTSMGRRPCEATFVDSNEYNVESDSLCRISGISSAMLEWSSMKNVTSAIPKEFTSSDEGSLCAEKSVAAIAIDTHDAHYTLGNNISICICAHTHNISSNSIRVSITGSSAENADITSISSATNCMRASNSSPTSTELSSRSRGRDNIQASGRCIPFLPLMTIFVFLVMVLNTPYLKFMTIRRIQSSQVFGALSRDIFLESTSSKVVLSSQEEPRREGPLHGVHLYMSSVKRAVTGASIMRPTRAYYMHACLLRVRRLLHSAASIVNWIRCLILKQFKRSENILH